MSPPNTDTMPDIHPLTIVRDRYCGTYSGALFTAWNMDADDVPVDINCGDCSCDRFWKEKSAGYPVGKGATIQEAVDDLKNQLATLRDNPITTHLP